MGTRSNHKPQIPEEMSINEKTFSKPTTRGFASESSFLMKSLRRHNEMESCDVKQFQASIEANDLVSFRNRLQP